MDANLDNLCSTIKSFPSLYKSRLKNDLYKKKLVYIYEKFTSGESFFAYRNLGRRVLFNFETIYCKYQRNIKNRDCNRKISTTEKN